MSNVMVCGGTGFVKVVPPFILLFSFCFFHSLGAHGAFERGGAPVDKGGPALTSKAKRKLSVGKKIFIAMGAAGLVGAGSYAAYQRYGQKASEPTTPALPEPDKPVVSEPALRSESDSEIGDGEYKEAEVGEQEEPEVSAVPPVALWKDRLTSFIGTVDVPIAASKPFVFSDKPTKSDDSFLQKTVLPHLFEGQNLEKMQRFVQSAMSDDASLYLVQENNPVYAAFIRRYREEFYGTSAQQHAAFTALFVLKQEMALRALASEKAQLKKLDLLLEAFLLRALEDRSLKHSMGRGFAAAYDCIQPTEAEKAKAGIIAPLFLSHKTELSTVFTQFFYALAGLLESVWASAASANTGMLRASKIPDFSNVEQYPDFYLFATAEAVYQPLAVRIAALNAFKQRKNEQGVSQDLFLQRPFKY